MKQTSQMDNNYLYIVTRDPYLTKEYFKLREQIYIKDFNLVNFSDHEDGLDNKDFVHILLVIYKNKVIGGLRIIMHDKNSDILLPLESKENRLKDILPNLNLDKISYNEVNRFVILPEFRIGFIAERIIYEVIMYSKILGSSFLFTVTPAVQARNFRKHCRKFNINFNILENVAVPYKPSYRGKKMILSLIDLTKTIYSSYEELLLKKEHYIYEHSL